MRLRNITLKRMFSERLRQVVVQALLSRSMLLLGNGKRFAGNIEDRSGAEEIVGSA